MAAVDAEIVKTAFEVILSRRDPERDALRMDAEQRRRRSAQAVSLSAEAGTEVERRLPHRSPLRWRQVATRRARSEMFSIAPCHMATGFGSRVGARLADIRPSYGRAWLSTMRPEAGLPDIA